jgi:hypothetical protein
MATTMRERAVGGARRFYRAGMGAGERVTPGHEQTPPRETVTYGTGTPWLQDAARPPLKVTFLSQTCGEIFASMIFVLVVCLPVVFFVPNVESPDAQRSVNGTCLLNTFGTPNPAVAGATFPGTGCRYPDWLSATAFLIIIVAGFMARSYVFNAFAETSFMDMDLGLALTSLWREQYVAGAEKSWLLRLWGGFLATVGASVGVLFVWAFNGADRTSWKLGGKGLGLPDFGVQYRYYGGFNATTGETIWTSDMWIALMAGMIQATIVVIGHDWSGRQESYYLTKDPDFKNQVRHLNKNHAERAWNEGLAFALANLIGGGIIGPYVGLSPLILGYILQIGTATNGARFSAKGFAINYFVIFVGYILGHIIGGLISWFQHWLLARNDNMMGYDTDRRRAVLTPTGGSGKSF